MDERIKRAVRAVVPVALLRVFVERFFRVRWTGDYGSWGAAARRSRGYDEAGILERVVTSTRLARDGRIAYERDGQRFHDPEPNERLLSVLHAATGGRGLSVLDFGGSLGSAYWQNRPWFTALRPLDWCVVEQPHFTAVGNHEFANSELHFCSSLEEAARRRSYDVLLLAGVLAYLPDPHAMLRRLAELSAAHVYIERTGVLMAGGRDRLTVQHVPRNLYPASYPCWFFDQRGVVSHFLPACRVAGVWPEKFKIVPGVEYRVLHFQRIET